MRSISRYFPLLARESSAGADQLGGSFAGTADEPGCLLASLISEFLNAAKLTAVATSMATARSSGRTLHFIGSSQAYFPGEPMIFPAVAGDLTKAIRQAAVVHALHDYYMRQRFVCALSQLPADQWRSGDRPSAGEWLELEDAWSRVCSAASVAMHQIPDICAMDDPIARYRLTAMHKLVNAARSSQAPCVRVDGTVVVPDWLDRRRHGRRTLGWKVWFEADGKRDWVTLQDISIGGMGLSACWPVDVGVRVEAVLPDDRRLCGIVAWSGDGRLGATFDTPLSPTDSLLFRGTPDAFGA